ncbi:MAG: PBP1A family penicillin-binding protein [Ardenticatenia bacterium]|nr:PBP1A family penicillin-binding protein [Ardenticatenia bacterium]
MVSSPQSPSPVPSGPVPPARRLGILPRAASGSVSCVVAAAAIAIAGLVAVGVGAAGLVYLRFAGSLPAPEELRARAATFRSSRILDKDGQPLAEAFDADQGRRDVVPLSEISPFLLQATVATEDRNFYQHRGVDPVAILRAMWYAVRERELVSGGSTITQQLVKRTLLTPERTLSRKLKEAVLAAEISRRYSKDEILELYLNEIFYGSLAYGCESAAQTLFGKSARDLSLAEAALLAGLPQAPAWYDPYSNPDRALGRQKVVLDLMVEAGNIDQAQADAAKAEGELLTFKPWLVNMNAPHFISLVRQQVEAITADPAALDTKGLTVTTTLDRRLQDAAERIVAQKVDALAARRVGNGALVAMEPETGAVRAFVGSKDWGDEAISGQVNMALAPRQPGSSLKPFVYLTAFRSQRTRWTPGTLLADILTEFPDGANAPYVPTNYDGQEHGMVTMRTALANSYNIPAVAALQAVGVDAFKGLLTDLGVSTLTRNDYGLSLALGSGEVPLIENTAAFAALAAGGRRTPPVAILKIVDMAGAVICETGTDKPCLPPEDLDIGREPVVEPAEAFLITDMLADNAARIPAFGPGNVLELDRPAAVKTGTTNDYRDNLTVGYTPQLVTGVWVGNADNTPMQGISGVTGAGPIWHDFMLAAHEGLPAQPFAVPDGVAPFEICRDTGTSPSDACPERATWFFAADRPPLGKDKDLWQRLRIDRATGLLAGEHTPDDQVEERVFKVYPLAEGWADPNAWRAWAAAHGIAQPPSDQSDRYTFAAKVEIGSPADGATVAGAVPVIGTVMVPDLDRYELSWGEGWDPDGFNRILRRKDEAVEDGELGVWETEGLPPGGYTLRLVARDNDGHAYEARVRVNLSAGATATASATPTATTGSATTATATAATATAEAGATRTATTAAPRETAKPSPAPATLAPRPTLVPRPTFVLPTDAPPVDPTLAPRPTVGPPEEPTVISFPTEAGP